MEYFSNNLKSFLGEGCKPLTKQLYYHAICLAYDSHERVKLASIKLLQAFSVLMPLNNVSNDGPVSNIFAGPSFYIPVSSRMVDRIDFQAAFSSLPILDQIFIVFGDLLASDVSVKVREAAGLAMSNLHLELITSRSLIQATLSKEIVVFKDISTRSEVCESAQRLESSSASEYQYLPISYRLVRTLSPHYICGVLSISLEDEFVNVRRAGLLAVFKILESSLLKEEAKLSDDFRMNCLKTMMDLFHDEDDSLRLHALSLVSSVLSQQVFILEHDLIHDILYGGLLNDPNPQVRFETLKCLGQMRIKDPNSLIVAIDRFYEISKAISVAEAFSIPRENNVFLEKLCLLENVCSLARNHPIWTTDCMDFLLEKHMQISLSPRDAARDLLMLSSLDKFESACILLFIATASLALKKDLPTWFMKQLFYYSYCYPEIISPMLLKDPLVNK